MLLRAENVFKPGAYPEYTYVSRNYENTGISYELRLKQALRTAGCLTSVIGPSKMGKTILCEKVVGLENIVEISGADFNENADFWSIVAAKVGLPYHGEVTTERFSRDERITEHEGMNEKYVLSKDKIIQYFIEHEKVLVLDDFHYASAEMQMKMAQQLKDAIRRELKVIVISLPHRADDAIRQNADLSGRLSLINIETWKEENLKKIALMGFEKLNIKIADSIAEKLAVECLTSPQLMQYICLSICTLLEDENKNEVTEEILERAYRFTTVNFNYADVVRTMEQGPNQRGQRRRLYELADGKSMDMYGLILETIAKNPPLTEIEFNTFFERITQLVKKENNDKRLEKQTVKDHLKKLQNVLDNKEEIYRAIEWKDSKVYVLDPLFLFYLRWGRKNG